MGLLSNIKAALFPEEQAPGQPPSWVGRLKPAKYWSPSGIEFEFLYLDLSFFIPVKTTAFQNVDSDGGYIQHNGLGIGRYPMLMVFSDGDNDERAKQALKALLEVGDGVLYHPVVGPVDVVPTGEIEQVNAFVTAANQTSLVIEFLEQSGFPVDDEESFPTAMDRYLDSSAQSFADTVALVDKAEEASLAQKALQRIKEIKKKMDAVSAGIAKTQSELDDTFDSINFAIDTLVKEPLMLARQMQNLIMTPSREISLIKDKLEAYKSLAGDIFGSNPSPQTNTYDNVPRNDFALDALIVGTSVAALTQSTYNASTKSQIVPSGATSFVIDDQNTMKYRKDFVAAQESIIDTNDSFIDWSDNGATDLGLTNNSGDSAELSVINQIAIDSATAQISLAKSEVKFTATYDRPAAAWCFEVYQSIKPDVLTYFQQTNDLGGDEILIIPAGRELVYYA